MPSPDLSSIAFGRTCQSGPIDACWLEGRLGAGPKKGDCRDAARTVLGWDMSADRALADLFAYPFMSCLVERRTRRIARGTSIDAGALSYTSQNRPAPLSKLEEAILIVSTGVTGLSTHDGPLEKPGGDKELGTPFLNIVARAASSADNCQATIFFVINDDGVFLLREQKGRAALDLLKHLPPRWSDWKEEDWLCAAESVKIR